MNLLGAAYQLLDFIWKALKHYASTDEGRAEALDIVEAWQGDESPDDNNPVSSYREGSVS